MSFEGALGVIVTSVSSNMQNYVDVYPTLAQDIIRVECNEHLFNGEFELTDLNGRVIISQRIGEPTTQINIASLPNGVYFYSLRKNQFIQTGKVIKQ